jgi:aminopeptidase N
MLMHAEIGAGDAVRCLTAVMRAETADTVIEPYLLNAARFAEQWSSDAERDRLVALVADTCRHLADASVHRRVALRGLARTAPDLDTVAWLEDAAGDDTDLRWRTLVRKAELGALDESAVERLLDVDPDPDAWVRGLTVRTAAPTEEAKREFWETAVVGRKVPIGGFGLVATAFWRPGQEHVTAPYAEAYLDLLPRLHEGGMIPAMVYTTRLFPLFGIDTGYLDRAEAAASSAAPVVRKTLAEQSDEVRRMLAVRAL